MAEGLAEPAVEPPVASNDDGADGAKKDEVPKEKTQKSLEQMMSLKPDDDERTEISKKMSWILRHGAKKVGLEIDDDGWIKIQDLLANDILKGVTLESLKACIEASNAQKPRYEVGSVDGSEVIRAVSKHTIQGMASAPPKEPRPRRRDGDEGGGKGGGKGGGGGGKGWEKGELWGQPAGRGAAAQGTFNNGVFEMGDGDALEAPTFHRGGQTFEQQLKDGYRPVYQGSSVVAMVKNGDLVKPGRRAEGGKGKGDKGKGKDGGKGRDDWDDFGKGGSGGFGGGDGKGKGKGKGKGDGFSNAGNGGWQPQRPPSGVKRWMVAVREEVIVKESHLVTSGQVGRLHSGDVVTQTGDEQVIEHGIVRMPIEHRVPGGTILRGWVTRTAEAANGPCYFRQVGGGGFEDYGGGKGGGGGHGYGGGKGYSPGKGNGKYGGGFN